MTGKEKGGLLIEVTTWAGVIVFSQIFKILSLDMIQRLSNQIFY
jgi:hypothetical protein